MTKLAPEWVRTSDPVIRSPARYRWTTAPAHMVSRDCPCVYLLHHIITVYMDDAPFHPFGAFKSKVLEHGALYDFLCKWGNSQQFT